MSEDKLIIDGKSYTTENLDKPPKHLQPEHISTKENGNMVVFFTFQSIYSNIITDVISNTEQ